MQVNENIWQKLKNERQPFWVLAPMEDVTDTVFRRLVAKYGKPDLFFTEFMNCDGYCSPGKEHVAHRLIHTEEERPLIAQIWGLKPENYLQVARELTEQGFDGIDINMGCPERSVFKSGACSALIENRSLASEIIRATQEGAGSLPVSVKTRIGTKEIITEDWIGFLLKHNLHALTVHGRTVKEQSLVPAHWDEIAKAVNLKNSIAPETVIVGNGDVESLDDGMEKFKASGVDGLMVGRGIFSDLLFFNSAQTHESLPSKKKFEIALEHVVMFEQSWGKRKNFAILKKFFKMHLKSFEGASELRNSLMAAGSYAELYEILNDAITKID